MEVSRSETRLAQLIREIVQRELPAGQPAPEDDADLVRTGLLDSMGWVAVLTGIEELTHISNFGSPWPANRPQSIRFLVEAAREGMKSASVELKAAAPKQPEVGSGGPVAVAGWGYAVGGVNIAAAEMESKCRLAPGTLQRTAGFESMRLAHGDEDQVSLGQSAAEAALEHAGVDLEEVGLLLTTSATFLGVPTFGAALHTRLLLRQSCMVLDVGGACVGLINALAAARAFLAANKVGTALVVASEVHSRVLSTIQAPGEFRGLFGDGACAFVLRPESSAGQSLLKLGSFTFGCSGGLASALEATLREEMKVEIQFKGDQLGRAAVDRLLRLTEQIELISGHSRSEATAFAIHEPNPRLTHIFAQNAAIPLDKIAFVSRTFGNLGSATCGVSLCLALERIKKAETVNRPLIFIAAVGPGVLWAGTYLH